jgi:hypothetical protein
MANNMWASVHWRGTVHHEEEEVDDSETLHFLDWTEASNTKLEAAAAVADKAR